MAQLNFHADEAQLSFLQLVGVSDVRLLELLDANLSEIATATPSFRSFIVPGNEHLILPTNDFYGAVVDGIRLRNWTANLIAGEEVPRVSCHECRQTPDAPTSNQ